MYGASFGSRNSPFLTVIRYFIHPHTEIHRERRRKRKRKVTTQTTRWLSGLRWKRLYFLTHGLEGYQGPHILDMIYFTELHCPGLYLGLPFLNLKQLKQRGQQQTRSVPNFNNTPSVLNDDLREDICSHCHQTVQQDTPITVTSTSNTSLTIFKNLTSNNLQQT